MHTSLLLYPWQIWALLVVEITIGQLRACQRRFAQLATRRGAVLCRRWLIECNATIFFISVLTVLDCSLGGMCCPSRKLDFCLHVTIVDRSFLVRWHGLVGWRDRHRVVGKWTWGDRDELALRRCEPTVILSDVWCEILLLLIYIYLTASRRLGHPLYSHSSLTTGFIYIYIYIWIS